MAKFRNSSPASDHERDERIVTPPADPMDGVSLEDRSIGDIIKELRNLTAEQVERVLVHQREKGVRFGEAAVALGFASPDDVLFALSQQFHYPYATEDQRVTSPELVALNQPFSRQSEAFRAIRSQVMMRLYSDGAPTCAIAIVSPEAGDGKTYFCANLAATLAQLGGRTLLVDADLRGPRQHEVFGISNTAGLSSILSGRAESQVIQQVVGVPSLFVLPVGVTPPNPLELVERPAFGLLLRELVAKFDHVIVDTPAAIHGSDAHVIAARCGAAILVARRDKGRMAMLHELADGITSSGSRLVGAVMNEF